MRLVLFALVLVTLSTGCGTGSPTAPELENGALQPAEDCTSNEQHPC